MYHRNEAIILERDCDAVLIPAGEPITLKAGDPVYITQTLGNNYTVYIHGNLARIAGQDLDADRGMQLDQPTLGVIQRPELVEDLVGDADLADVVQEKPVLEARIVEQARLDHLGERDRVVLNALRM